MMVDLTAERDALAKGTQRGQYRIEGVIGAGGDALIYSATDMVTAERCVLKEFYPLVCATRDKDCSIQTSDPDLARNFDLALIAFEQEAELLTEISHPNLIGCRGRVSISGGSFIVLEHQFGMTLERLFTQSDWDRSAQYWWQALQGILGALRSLHCVGYLHGDLSARNIIMRPDNTLVLLDLGSALPVRSQQKLQSVSRANCAIELVAQHRPADISADIFSVSSILYHAVTGHACPSATDRIDGAALAPLVGFAKTDFERAFYAAIDAALALSADKRPQTVDAFFNRVAPTRHLQLLPSLAALNTPLLAKTPQRQARIWSVEKAT